MTSLTSQDLVLTPVTQVIRRPDYWSGGHFHQGSGGYVSPFAVEHLPVGTVLYAYLRNRLRPAHRSGARTSGVLQMTSQDLVLTPVTQVIRRPDYWSGGHFHHGSEGYVSPLAVEHLPVCTVLYAYLPAPTQAEQIQAQNDQDAAGGFDDQA